MYRYNLRALHTTTTAPAPAGSIVAHMIAQAEARAGELDFWDIVDMVDNYRTELFRVYAENIQPARDRAERLAKKGA